MSLNLLAQEAIAFVFYFLYGSFFEWWFHKNLFHSPKLIKATFKAHQLVHHQQFKYEIDSYHLKPDADRTHIAMDWFALPIFLAVHLPLLLGVQWLTHWQSAWGGLAAITAYYVIYESFHYCMHVPADRWFETLGTYRFVKEHHRIHHKYFLQNLNVFFPLADLCLGTYRSAASIAASKPAVTTGTKPVEPSSASSSRPLARTEPANAPQ